MPPKKAQSERVRNKTLRTTPLGDEVRRGVGALLLQKASRLLKVYQVLKSISLLSWTKHFSSRVRLAAVPPEAEDIRHHVSLFDAVPIGLYMVDDQDRLVIANRCFASMYGLDVKDLVPGAPVNQLFRTHCRANSEPIGPTNLYPTSLFSDFRPRQTIERLDDGRVIEVTAIPLTDGNVVVLHQDVTERQNAIARAEFLALHDGLTGLANRIAFHNRLISAVSNSTSSQRSALLAIDLDHFKTINDTHGHATGDALLIAVAERLHSLEDNNLSAARLGGDEFAVIFEDFRDLEEIEAMVRRVIERLSAPYYHNNSELITTVSIGVAVAPDDTTDTECLTQYADMALYRAKREERGTYRFFENELERRTRNRLELAFDLRRAITEDELELYYQPLFALAGERLVGFEALLRWNHPSRGHLVPSDFLVLAEESGLIRGIGAWVLSEACKEAAKWPDHLALSVNVSAVQLRGPGLLHDVALALGASGLPANRLQVEVTESVLLSEDEATLAIFQRLRGLGIQIAIDNFGAGHSLLGYLRRFAFDSIKIDRSFVQSLNDDESGRVVIRAITRLCAELGIKATAEGVETAAQLESLCLEGCEFVQGFHLGRPIPAHKIGPLLKRGSTNSRTAHEKSTTKRREN